MYEAYETIIWVGNIKWKLQEFVVEVELEKQSGCVYINEIRNLYWNDKVTNSSKEIIDLFVDIVPDKQYDELTAAIVAAYLETKQKGE